MVLKDQGRVMTTELVQLSSTYLSDVNISRTCLQQAVLTNVSVNINAVDIVTTMARHKLLLDTLHNNGS